MRKIRIVFVALAVALWIPMAVLVQGALESVAVEREVRHQTLAERVFDEMERQLGDLSEREQARSFGEYSFYLGGAMDASRSPLSLTPLQRFVVGYFQIDPDGGFSTPSVPAHPSHAIERGDWPSADLPEVPVAKLESLAREGIGSKQRWGSQLAALGYQGETDSVSESESASSTAALPKLQKWKERQRKKRQDEIVEQEPLAEAPGKSANEKVDSYQVAVRSLNRAGERKIQNKRKELAFAPEVASSVARRSTAVDEGRARNMAQRSPAPSAARSMDFDDAAGKQLDALIAEESFAAPSVSRPTAAPSFRQRSAAEPSFAKDARVAADPVQARDRAMAARGEGAVVGRAQQVVEVDSIVGHWVDDHYVVLHRSATLAGRLYRQGLVVDVSRLADWLRDEVLRGNPLQDRAVLSMMSSSSAGSPRRYRPDYSYPHRFADPFDEVSATLSLPLLADAGGSGYLYAISALLVIVGTVGLFALYRMVAVTVGFAERRNNFVAAVTHELKTPLTAIRMYGEMLRDDMVPDEEKRREYYATITAESERLTRLINNVLEFSRIEQGTREMSMVAGSIGPVIEEAVGLLEPHAQEQGFAIEVDIAPNLPAVRFDRDALLQVLFNLVDNALKYARGADDRVIRLHARCVDDSVVLSVCDRGPGVSSAHLPKIFEPFYRGQKELTRTAKGTGIGLALVQGLCERMGAVVSGRNGNEGGFEVLLTFRPA